MPHASDLAELSLVIKTVHYSVRPKEDLAKIVTPIFRNNATKFGKLPKALCLGNQFVPEGHCAVGVVACNEDDYIVKIVSCSGRPD